MAQDTQSVSSCGYNAVCSVGTQLLRELLDCKRHIISIKLWTQYSTECSVGTQLFEIQAHFCSIISASPITNTRVTSCESNHIQKT
jgi:hypothetical protein